MADEALDIMELNRLYDEADTRDKEVFAEQRTSILLLSGEHYSKRGTMPKGIRSARESEDSLKLRITKNYTHKVHRYYKKSLLDYVPGAVIEPQNKYEQQDVKVAELNQAVWSHLKKVYKLRAEFRKYASDFSGIGECCAFIRYDYSKGEVVAYEQAVDPDTEEPLFEEDPETGELLVEMDPTTGTYQYLPKADEERPVYKGAFVFERIPPYNVLTSDTRDMKDAECWIIRRMASTAKLKRKYKGDADKLGFIEDASDDEFIIFDASRGGSYGSSKGKTLIREHYWPKCEEYPEGWFTISTRAGILEEGPLPGGIWPIIWAAFDEYPSSPRGRGITRVARPYQAEINRASSAMAMHQITIGDDKVLYQAGTKMSQGALLPGVRGIQYQGAQPTILAGRDGGQFYQYVLGTRDEMYDNLMMQEILQEKGNAFDPTAFLFATAVEKKNFSEYSEKFEDFIVEFVETTLELARFYLPDDEVIRMAGRREQVNIAEFRNTQRLEYLISVEKQAETLESRFGRQITGMQIMQYLGKQLTRDDIAKLVRKLPFADFTDIADAMNLDEVNTKNDMLAMERGEEPFVGYFDDDQKVSQLLVKRMKEPDFRFLPPQVQQAYHAKYQKHLDASAEKEAKILRAKNEYIPVDGAMVRVDMYVPDPKDPTKSKRAEVPQRAMEWLLKQLEAQGMSLEKMQTMNEGQLAHLADAIFRNQGLGQAAPALPQAM